jgi:hypothetical protein
MSNFVTGQSSLTNSHHACSMDAAECQDYIDLVILKADQLGPHYVERQVTWAADQLDRLSVGQVRPNGPFVVQPELLEGA